MLAKDCLKCAGAGRVARNRKYWEEEDEDDDGLTITVVTFKGMEYCGCELGRLLELAERGIHKNENNRSATVDERVGAAYEAVTVWVYPIDKIVLPIDIGGRDPAAELRRAVEKFREADLFASRTS